MSACCAPDGPERPAQAASPWPRPPRELRRHTGLIALPGGTFTRGTRGGVGYDSDGESPPHPVSVSPFAVATCAVSNNEFAAFVDATGYRTLAEVGGWSFVFGGLLPDDFPPTQGVAEAPWWRRVEGADWRHPEGPHSDLAGRSDHPVVHVSWHDAVAYCRWAGARLPTETEWEYAARGGLDGALFPWGDELEPGGEHRMNVFQGTFPAVDTGADGYRGTCPVDAFQPNGFGLFNVTGNVWEWCADWFNPTSYTHDRGPDPLGPRSGTDRVMRGGSYLCHASYCHRYRVGARSASSPDSTSGNVGFRVAAHV